jgi:hypothetical protein
MKKLLIINLLSLSISGQDLNTMQLEPGASSPAATLEVMSWLRGEWAGAGLGGYCEEVWTSARGGSMLGTFRVIKEDKPVFSELMEIVEAGGSILLRLKHFGNDFTGWEERDKYIEFRLVKIEGDSIYFDGLTYRRTGENSMMVYVVLNTGDTSREAEFSYTKAEP